MAPVHGSIAPSDRFSDGGVGGDGYGFDGEGSSDREGNSGSWEFADESGLCAGGWIALTS
jgi:hypothetical protein